MHRQVPAFGLLYRKTTRRRAEQTFSDRKYYRILGKTRRHPLNGGWPPMGRLGKVVPTAVTVHLWFTLCRTRVRQTDLVSNDVRHRTFPSHLRVAFFWCAGTYCAGGPRKPGEPMLARVSTKLVHKNYGFLGCYMSSRGSSPISFWTDAASAFLR